MAWSFVLTSPLPLRGVVVKWQGSGADDRGFDLWQGRKVYVSSETSRPSLALKWVLTICRSDTVLCLSHSASFRQKL
jgi:hypothetical protein